MPNVFADTHNRPAAPAPHAPSESVPILYAVRVASGSRLDAIAAEVGVPRRAFEPDSSLRARLIDSYAEHLQVRLGASQALVGRIRAAIGARSGESTDAALARLDAEIMPASAAVGARAGESLAVAARRVALDLKSARATLDAVKHAVGLPGETPASEVSAFFRCFEADVEGTIAPTKRGAWETLGEAIKRHHAALEGIVRGVREAIGAPEGIDLVGAVADLQATLSAVERATGMPARSTAAEVRAHFDRLSASALEATSRMPARAGETLVERVDRFFEEATEALRLVGATCAALGCSPADLVSAAAKARVDSNRLSKIRAALGL